MEALWTTVSFIFTVGVLALVVYVLVRIFMTGWRRPQH